MRVITASELVEILRKHKLWLENKPDGERANLYNADLRYANLYNANLYNADLRYADLRYADLRYANLYNANLRYANLYNANLRYANLYNANLRYANLYNANLYNADLRYANLQDADRYCPIACPEEGSFIGFKKCSNNLIVKLEIPEDALRCSATSRKCRCSKAKVLNITKIDGSEANVEFAISKYDPRFVYKVGEVVSVDNFETNRWKECSSGIHFFITRQEAVNY